MIDHSKDRISEALGIPDLEEKVQDLLNDFLRRRVLQQEDYENMNYPRLLLAATIYMELHALRAVDELIAGLLALCLTTEQWNRASIFIESMARTKDRKTLLAILDGLMAFKLRTLANRLESGELTIKVVATDEENPKSS